MSYRRGMNYNEMDRGYQRNQQMNPWNNSSDNMRQNPNNYQDNTTLLLANNLINNLFRNSNNMLPSLLDVNPTPMNQDYGNRRMRHGVPAKMLNRSNMSRQGNRDFSHKRVAKMPNMGNNSKRLKQYKKNPGNFVNRNIKSEPVKRSNNSGNTNQKEPEKNESGDNLPENTENSNKETIATDADNKTDAEKKIANEFEGVDKRFFKCHVCKKSMWDGTSFKKHLKGRAHLMMMESLSDSYAIKGQLIRHEIRMAENTRQIETERKRRFGKGQNVNKQSMPVFCAMCDTEFTNTTLTLHRHSSGHLRLKRFLHPKCNSCDAEFPTRIDWDEHRLSTSHIKKISELDIIQLNTEEQEVKDFIEQGESAGIDMQKYTTAAIQSEAEDIKTEDYDNNEEGDKTAKFDNLTDMKDDFDVEGLTIADLPKYDPNVPVGMSFIKEMPCYGCTVCHHFMASSEAAAVHMKSLKHYECYMKIMKKRVASAQKKDTKQPGNDTTNQTDGEEAETNVNADKSMDADMSNDQDESLIEDKDLKQENSELNTTIDSGKEQISSEVNKEDDQNESVENAEENSMLEENVKTEDKESVIETTPTKDIIDSSKQLQNSANNKPATPTTRAAAGRGGRGNRARRGTPRRY